MDPDNTRDIVAWRLNEALRLNALAAHADDPTVAYQMQQRAREQAEKAAKAMFLRALGWIDLGADIDAAPLAEAQA